MANKCEREREIGLREIRFFEGFLVADFAYSSRELIGERRRGAAISPLLGR